MKTLLALAAAGTLAALAGCAAYRDPYGYPGGVYPATGVYQTVPAYGPYGGGYGQYGAYPAYPSYPTQGVPGARRDRDHDGIPNRIDRDRDGDGVPNEFDRRPNNPARR